MKLLYAAIALLLALLTVTPATTQGPEGTVRGEVKAVDYDDDGNVTEIAIYDFKWGSVLVLNSPKGAELLNHVGAVVSATGEVRELDEDSDYHYGVKVTSYTIEEPEELEEYPDGDPER